MAKLTGLCELLVELFNTEELRRFMSDLPAGPETVRSLDLSGPLDGVVEDAVAALERRGMIDGVFFEALSATRPRRVYEINLARALWTETHRPVTPTAEAVNDATSWALRPGMTLGNGRYKLSKRVGEGRYGQVWKAEDTHEKLDVALKFLRRTHSDNTERSDQFFRSARVMSSLRGPGVVQILDIPENSDGRNFYVMEFASKGNIHSAVLGGCPTKDGLLAVLAAAKAVCHAHGARVLHRNIKPSNILVTADHGAKLTDFDLGDEKSEVFGSYEKAIGSVFYTAPEILSDPAVVSERADVYSLGMVVLFVLAGRDLTLEVVRDHDASIDALKPSSALRSLIRRATSWDTEHRYKTVQEFIYDLELCLLDADDELVLVGPELHARAPLLSDSAWTSKMPLRVQPLRVLFIGPVSTDAYSGKFPAQLKKWASSSAIKIAKAKVDLDIELVGPDLEHLFGLPRTLRLSIRSIEDLTPENLPRLVAQVAHLLDLRRVLEEILAACGSAVSATLLLKGILMHKEADGATKSPDGTRIDEIVAVLRKLAPKADAADGLSLLQQARGRIDEALTTIAATILSDPRVAAIRTSWSSLRILESAYDPREPIEVSVWDIDKRLFVQDCADYVQPDHTNLAQILDAAAGQLGATPFSIVCCGWALSDEAGDRNALSFAANICANLQAVFLTNLDSSVLHRGAFAVPSNWINSAAWRKVASDPSMRHVSVCFPRFLLSEASETDSLGSTKLSRSYRVPALWGYSSVLLTYCAVRSFARYRVCSFASGLEDGLVPLDGQAKTAATEFQVTANTRRELLDWGVTTVTSVRSRCYMFESIRSAHRGDGALFPFTMFAVRVAQSCRSLFREHHEDGQDISAVETQLQSWLGTLVADGGSYQRRPLQRATISVRTSGAHGEWMYTVRLAPYVHEGEPVEITVNGSLK